MTDTTHEAPERIWAGKYRGTWWQSRPHHQMTEYVRADLSKERSDEVQAAVAAALREAAALFEQDALDMRAEENTLYWTAENDAKRILALITPDAQAALDRVVAAERERCAKVAGDAWMDGVPIAEIPATIRKGGE